MHQYHLVLTAEMIKALDEVGVDWLHTILNEFLTDERIPGDIEGVK